MRARRSGRSHISFDPKQVWNVQEPDLNWKNLAPIKPEDVRRLCNMSPNDYFWHPLYNDRILVKVDDEDEEDERKSRQRRDELGRQMEKEHKRLKRHPNSAWFINHLRQIPDFLDLDRVLPGCPSSSYVAMNKQEYYDDQLITQEDIDKALIPVMEASLAKPSPPRDLPDSTSGDHPPATKDHPGLVSILKDHPVPVWASSRRPKFPNRKAEQVYSFVEDVLVCYQTRRGRYAMDSVFPQLEVYRKKVLSVQAGFEKNLFGIRDKIPKGELRTYEVEITNAVRNAVHLIGKFEEKWKECNEQAHYLEKTVLAEMAMGCLDSETIEVARDLGKTLITSMEQAYLGLIYCFDPLSDVYGLCIEMQDFLTSSTDEES